MLQADFYSGTPGPGHRNSTVIAECTPTGTRFQGIEAALQSFVRRDFRDLRELHKPERNIRRLSAKLHGGTGL